SEAAGHPPGEPVLPLAPSRRPGERGVPVGDRPLGELGRLRGLGVEEAEVVHVDAAGQDPEADEATPVVDGGQVADVRAQGGADQSRLSGLELTAESTDEVPLLPLTDPEALLTG